MADDKREEGDTPAPAVETTATEGTAKPVSRRLLVFKTLAGALTLAAVTAVTTEKASAQYYLRRGTDNDPYDPRGGGRLRPVRRRITDNDPYDAAGRGRGRRVRRRFVTDNDPYDARGRGRGW